MSIYSTKKIADSIGLTDHKDYTRVLKFIEGNRVILKPHELSKMQQLIDKDYKILTACIKQGLKQSK